MFSRYVFLAEIIDLNVHHQTAVSEKTFFFYDRRHLFEYDFELHANTGVKYENHRSNVFIAIRCPYEKIVEIYVL